VSIKSRKIVKDKQHFKTQVQDMINNPSEWDFMEKPKKNIVKKGKPFHYDGRK